MSRGLGERFEEVVGMALPDDLAAEFSGAGAEVDEVIGAADRFLVVLDDDEGVPLCLERDEGVEKGGVVARVESYGGFVEDVENSAEI